MTKLLPARFRAPYTPNPLYSKLTAYLSMEFAIDQSLKTYSGGLGFLAGSHMRSAYELKQNMVGIGILWSYGYYDQARADDNRMHPQFRRKSYNFLEDTGIEFQIDIHNSPVWIKVWYLKPEQFGTVPMFFLTTDTEKNDPLARSTCYRLYDSNPGAKVAQCMVLGIGGFMLMKKLGIMPDVFHMNEAHALPTAFKLFEEFGSVELVKKHLVFTTHTPEEAGNEKHLLHFLEQMGFFGNLDLETVRAISGVEGEIFNHSLVALRLSRKANAVSKLHGDVSRSMWSSNPDICPIIHITNSQNQPYWMDKQVLDHLNTGNLESISNRKKQLKQLLFEEVADQTGKWFNPDVLTIVWARRFAQYKRPDLITRKIEEFENLLNDARHPVQIIWAGKPYPLDQQSINIFNHLIKMSWSYPNMAVMTGYELKLSRLLKYGADIWLNTPIVTREASGTSGMTAAMNGGINLSTDDGWICEFAQHGKNAFVMPKAPSHFNEEERDEFDRNSFFNVLNQEVKPLYYNETEKWQKIMLQSMKDVLGYFESSRMAEEYYRLLYS
jgi:glycogen phosphorylase